MSSLIPLATCLFQRLQDLLQHTDLSIMNFQNDPRQADDTRHPTYVTSHFSSHKTKLTWILASAKDTKWVTQHMDACEEIGVTWRPPVPKHLAKNEWLAVVQKREQEIICNSHNLNPSNLWVDTSQNVSRARPSTHEEVPTVVPGSHLWNFSINRYLTGREFMRVQGYPFESLPGAATNRCSMCRFGWKLFFYVGDLCSRHFRFVIHWKHEWWRQWNHSSCDSWCFGIHEWCSGRCWVRFVIVHCPNEALV